MIKQLTLFCTFAIFMLAFGGTVTPLQAHCQPDGLPHAPPHPHCPADQLYSVKIFGINENGRDSLIFYGEGKDWQSNTKQVGFNHSSPSGPNGYLNLNAFRAHFGSEGDACFRNSKTPISSVILQKAKRGTAKALIWFWGHTHEVGNNTLVLYHFEFNGEFVYPKDWPPEDPDIPNTLLLYDWELHLGNEGNSIKAISCLSSGELGDELVSDNPPIYFHGIEIDVDRYVESSD